jgi:hypothetical protein
MDGAKYDPSLLRPLPPAVKMRRIDAAIQAARAAARGERDHADVRELLVAELGTRGLMMPPPMVDLMVDDVTAGPLQRLAFQAKMGVFAVRFLSAAARHQTLPRWDDTPMRFVYSSLPIRSVDVILDEVAAQHLDFGDADTFEIWFGLSTAGPDQASQPVIVFRGDYRVGVLDSEASTSWSALLHDSRDMGQTVVTFATRQRAGNGEWRLLTGVPREAGKRSYL